MNKFFLWNKLSSDIQEYILEFLRYYPCAYYMDKHNLSYEPSIYSVCKEFNYMFKRVMSLPAPACCSYEKFDYFTRGVCRHEHKITSIVDTLRLSTCLVLSLNTREKTMIKNMMAPKYKYCAQDLEGSGGIYIVIGRYKSNYPHHDSDKNSDQVSGSEPRRVNAFEIPKKDDTLKGHINGIQITGKKFNRKRKNKTLIFPPRDKQKEN